MHVVGNRLTDWKLFAQLARNVQHNEQRLLQVVARNAQKMVVDFFETLERKLGAYARGRDAEVKRLGDVIVRAVAQRGDDVVRLIETGDHDNRDIEQRPALAQVLEYLKAAAVRQTDVEQNEIVLVRFDGLGGFRRVFRVGEHATLALELKTQNFSDRRLIVDDEHVRR